MKTKSDLDLKAEKNPWMFGLIIFCWLGNCFYFSPRLLALLIGPENVLAKLAIIAFTILLNLFWFYGFYHLIIIIFSYLKNTKIPENKLKNYEMLLKPQPRRGEEGRCLKF